MRINIYVPADKLKTIDDWCTENRYSRSEVFVAAALERVGTPARRNAPVVEKPAGKKLGATPKGVKPGGAVFVNSVEEIVAKKNISLCEHGSMKGLCKHGC